MRLGTSWTFRVRRPGLRAFFGLPPGQNEPAMQGTLRCSFPTAGPFGRINKLLTSALCDYLGLPQQTLTTHTRSPCSSFTPLHPPYGNHYGCSVLCSAEKIVAHKDLSNRGASSPPYSLNPLNVPMSCHVTVMGRTYPAAVRSLQDPSSSLGATSVLKRV